MFNETQPVVWPGQPYPLGSTWDGEGVNLALYSEHAEKVELCLFDSSGEREALRVQIREQTDMVWHGYLPELRPVNADALKREALPAWSVMWFLES